MKLKENLAKKLKKSGGFTLIEMLIVVAIIAILVAVSIPMVNASLDEARKATDAANLRAAKAAAVAEYLLDESKMGTEAFYCYDAKTGKALAATSLTTCSDDDVDAYGQVAKGHVHVQIAADGTTTTGWVE